jgi:cystathionine beta-lyase family protein involved in aluminum resistance
MNELHIKKRILRIAEAAEDELDDVFKKINSICDYNSTKILLAMHKNKLDTSHFCSSYGYGYDDHGRDVLENIYACVFNTEDALVRSQIVSGTHAIYIALQSNLSYKDELLCISGTPYETLQKIISRLTSKDIIYKEINLDSDYDFDYDAIKSNISHKTKVIFIQRSRGYSQRESISVNKIIKVIDFIKNISNDIVCVVDNCYGEFVETKEPSDLFTTDNKSKADLVVGSLIKNPGGGIARSGGYLVGKKKFIDNAACFLTGIGKNIGASINENFNMLQGLFIAPQTVCCALKTAVFAAYIFSKLGFEVSPKPFDHRTDIVQAITFNSYDLLKKFCRAIQEAGPVDSFVTPIEELIPGYNKKIIMAAGTFIQGASIEFSADAPIQEPYTVFLQGAQTWSHGKLGVIIAADRLLT